MTQATPPPPVPKKGLSGLAIAGLGCAGLFILLVVLGVFIAFRAAHNYVDEFKKNPAKAEAMLALRTNSEMKVVRTDDAAGTLTIHDQKTGEDVTVTYDDINSGRFSVLNSKGQGLTIHRSTSTDRGAVVNGPDGVITFGGAEVGGAPPDWVPSYPGAKSSATVRTDQKDSLSGMVTVETVDSPGKMKDFYEGKFKGEGYQTETAAVEGADSAVLTATKDDLHRKVTVILSHKNDKTTATVMYEGAKP